MAKFRITRPDGQAEEYPVPESLTLGEAAELEALIPGFDFETAKGAQRLHALLFAAMRRVNPATTVAEVSAFDLSQISGVEHEQEAEGRPPAVEAAGSADVAAPASETTPEGSGRLS